LATGEYLQLTVRRISMAEAVENAERVDTLDRTDLPDATDTAEVGLLCCFVSSFNSLSFSLCICFCLSRSL